jgi:3-oxosteroid 1-dehydrogenase
VAGLTAALSAAEAGLRPLVVEHADQVGGTSARSSGTVWIPGSHYLRDHGILDDAARAEAYLSALVGNAGEAAMWKAFLDQGPRMLADLEKRAGLVFRPFMQAPDYRQDIEGAAAGGRALEPPAFDGRLLAQDFDRAGLAAA